MIVSATSNADDTQTDSAKSDAIEPDVHRLNNDDAITHDVESLWSRLRRRKVVQWGVAYVAAAWVRCRALRT